MSSVRSQYLLIGGVNLPDPSFLENNMRTTVNEVKTALARNYDSAVDLSPYLKSASVVVDRLIVAAANKGYTLTSTELELIECWLSCWMYTQTDPMYKSKRTGSASGRYDDHTYLNNAYAVDWTNCLQNLIMNQKATLVWGGKAVSEKVNFNDRN